METLRYTQDNGIAIITFNRPENLNALDLATMQRFAEVIQQVKADQQVRVVILTGTGQRAFCSGGDLYELSQYPSEADGRHFITIMGDALLELERLPVPVIAAINGYALGGGSEIAVACDMRIVDEHARMGFIQVRLALTPGWGAGQRLLRLIGYPRAMDILLQGHVLHAPEILQIGLARKVVEAGTALQQALNMARHIADHPPDVVRGIKALLRAGLEHSYEEALRIERDLFPPLWAAEPHLKAVDDFLERERARKQKAGD
ncbi:MAG: enoyl-CoA hydratase-related protein [Anaerolineae bacterium]